MRPNQFQHHRLSFSQRPTNTSFDKRGNQNDRIQSTPKPVIFGTARGPAVNIGKPMQYDNQSPMLARSFADIGLKKRDYSEAHQSQNLLRQTPQPNTPYYTFDDSSTVKPNENTIIRNPTLILKFGPENKQQALNRSHHVQPVNLSKLEFDDHREEAESNYKPGRATPYFQQKHRAETPLKQRDYTSKEISDFCLKVSIILNDMMNTEADIKATDIALNQLEGKQYEILPYLFSVSNQFKLPQVIRREINDQIHKKDSYVDYGFLEGVSTAYFCFDKNLYLWSFPQTTPDVLYRQNVDIAPLKYEFDQMVTAVALASPLPGMDAKTSDKILIVVTVTEIKIFYYIKSSRDAKIELIDTQFSLPTDQNVVSKIIQFRKNGRVFYGGSTGHVIELKYQDSSNFNILSLLQGERRKLKKNDHQSDSIFRKLIPGFFKFIDNKSLTDIKIDEHRNVLYSISMSLDNDTLNETIIEVFDLGLLSNKFQKIATIYQHEIVRMMLEYWEKDSSIRKGDLYRLSQDYKIVYVQPVNVSESQRWHLLLITQNGFRIYIHFELQEAIEPTTEELQEEYVNTDYFVDYRFTNRFRIDSIMYFPSQNSFSELNVFENGVGAFTGGSISSVAQGLQLDNQGVHYDSYDGILTYVQQSNDQDGHNGVDSNDRIVLNYIKKNESSLAYNRMVNEAGISSSFCKLIECYSQLSIPLEKALVRNKTPTSLRDDHYEYLNESVIDLQSNKRAVSNETSKLIGLKKTYFDAKGINASPTYEIQSLSEFEKQVYHLPNQINILTDNRVIEIQQLRPIDFLAMLLQNLTDNKALTNQIDNFEEFLDLFSVRESMSMLLQIVLERDATYTFSRKVQENLNLVKQKEGLKPTQSLSKSQLFKKGSLLDQSGGYQGRIDVVDQLRFRKILPEERSNALQLLKKYGDTIVSIRQQFDISEDSLEGMPQNVQDFSIKHFAMYQYLQRVLRPFWSMKLAYKLENQQDQFYKPTFESLQMPKRKLIDLLEFIDTNELSLYGEVYTPNIKTGEKFVRNAAILNVVYPVHNLKNSDKTRLELMEKNSLKNLKFFITRTIQAIDMLSILTFNSDPKMFNAVQKAIGDKSIVTEFAETTFRDLITMESNALIRRFLEASVQVETQDSEEAQSIMRQKYAHINKACSTFFSKNENLAFIGVTLLQAARKERNIVKKEELLKQAIDHLRSQPLNIDMNQIPQLLVDNGNYSSLGDLTLIKIKALESLSKEQRERLMSEAEFIDQRDQCYSVIISLFAAIDQSISKDTGITNNKKDQDYIEYFLNKLNAIQNNELKIQLRDKILRRIEMFNDEVVMTALFDYLIGKPANILNVDNLPQLNQKTLNKIFDETLKSDSIKLNKFDSIVKLLMKRKDAERLCIIAINACQDQYIIENASGQQTYLTLEQKLSLINTAKIVMDDQRTKLSQDSVYNFDRKLKEIEDRIDFQYKMLENIVESTSGLSQYISYQKQIQPNSNVQQEEQQLNRLRQLQGVLGTQLMDYQQIQRECEQNLLYEALIVRLFSQTQRGRKPQNIQRLINDMINYYFKIFNQQLEKLFTKYVLFTDDQELLKQFLEEIQRKLNQEYGHAPITNQIETLLKSNLLKGTRFMLIEFCFQNLVMAPLRLYHFFTPKVGGPFQNQQILEQSLSDIAVHITLVKQWILKNQQLFGDKIPQMPEFKLGQKTPQEIFAEDLRNNGNNIYNNFAKICNNIENSDSLIELDKDLANLLVQSIQYLQDQFRKMLIQHGIIREDGASIIGRSQVSLQQAQEPSLSLSAILPQQTQENIFGQAQLEPMEESSNQEEESEMNGYLD